MPTIANDIRFAVRLLTRSPILTQRSALRKSTRQQEFWQAFLPNADR